MNNIEIVVKDFSVRDRHFVIINKETETGKWFLAIEDKYIDEHGKMKKALNGLQMYADRDLNGCLNRVKDAVEIDYLVSTGMSRTEAIKAYWVTIEETVQE